MTVESATYIDELNPATIGNTTDPTEGGAQVSLVKQVLVSSFPNVGGEVTSTHTELNYLDITTLGTAQASKALTVSAGSAINATGITWTALGTVTTCDINGGTLDGVTIAGSSTLNASVIGGTTPAAGTFTTLAANTSFVLNGSTALTSVDTDLSTVSASHDTMTTAKAVKDYVDTEIAALDFASEAYVDGKARVVYTGSAPIANGSGANTFLIPMGVTGTVTRLDVTSSAGAVNLASVVLNTSSGASMATATPTGGAIASDTSIDNAAVTAGSYLQLVITDSGLGATNACWCITVAI